MLAKLADDPHIRSFAEFAQWHIALTEPRREGLAAGYLHARGFEPYLPTLPVTRAHGGFGSRAQRSSERPMFPGYLLVKFSTAMPGWERLFTTPGIRPVHSLLRCNGRYAILPDAAVAEIVAMEKSKRSEHNKPVVAHAFKVGECVQFKSWPEGGPFSGFFADIEQLDDDGRITLLISIFNQRSRATVSPDLLAAS